MLKWFFQQHKSAASVGQRGEEAARREYQKNGYRILASNVYNKKGLRKGEIDFIARKDGHLAFVEVKTRTTAVGQFGSPADAVNFSKRQKILKAVKIYLLEHPEFAHLQPRVDVCAVLLPEFDKTPQSVIIIPNAVEDVE